MQDFRNLDVWHRSHALALEIHRALARTRRVDAHIRSQMSRAANSIPANLVEGCGKDSRAELARFADIAIGSASELEYWLLLAKDLGQMANADHERLTTTTVEVRKMLFGLRRSIREGKSAAAPSGSSGPSEQLSPSTPT